MVRGKAKTIQIHKKGLDGVSRMLARGQASRGGLPSAKGVSRKTGSMLVECLAVHWILIFRQVKTQKLWSHVRSVADAKPAPALASDVSQKFQTRISSRSWPHLVGIECYIVQVRNLGRGERRCSQVSFNCGICSNDLRGGDYIRFGRHGGP